jgi:hypothetical protein
VTADLEPDLLPEELRIRDCHETSIVADIPGLMRGAELDEWNCAPSFLVRNADHEGFPYFGDCREPKAHRQGGGGKALNA